MKSPASLLSLCLAAVTLAVGCGRKAELPTQTPVAQNTSSAAEVTGMSWVLAPHDGNSRIDQQIRQWQGRLREQANSELALERLGWLFVAKARESFDAGFYKLAEQCAACLEERKPGSEEAMLLRGHALQNQHRFKEAEPLARALAERRGLPFDFGLLGDVLMEQGQLAAATDAYQKMIDLRPGPQSYARGAHIRWLKGDLAGATELMQEAASASSPKDPEAAAWTYSRLAGLQFQSGACAEARQNCDAALALRPDYPPALLLRGRMLLGEDATEAVENLERAARANPLPDYQWTLAEALRAAGREPEAKIIESRLRQHGVASDPRTLSLYLATRGEEPELAVRLAEEELQHRRDVFTHDALAWALLAAGRVDEARDHMARALAEGTQDARLYLHAAVIAAKSARLEEAGDWMVKAAELSPLLLPSELEHFHSAARLAQRDVPINN